MKGPCGSDGGRRRYGAASPDLCRWAPYGFAARQTRSARHDRALAFSLEGPSKTNEGDRLGPLPLIASPHSSPRTTIARPSPQRSPARVRASVRRRSAGSRSASAPPPRGHRPPAVGRSQLGHPRRRWSGRCGRWEACRRAGTVTCAGRPRDRRRNPPTRGDQPRSPHRAAVAEQVWRRARRRPGCRTRSPRRRDRTRASTPA